MRLKFVYEALFHYHKKTPVHWLYIGCRLNVAHWRAVGASTLASHSLSLIKNLVSHWFSLCLGFMATRDPREVVDSVSTVALLWKPPKVYVLQAWIPASECCKLGGGASKRNLAFQERRVGPAPLLLDSLPLSWMSCFAMMHYPGPANCGLKPPTLWAKTNSFSL